MIKERIDLRLQEDERSLFVRRSEAQIRVVVGRLLVRQSFRRYSHNLSIVLGEFRRAQEPLIEEFISGTNVLGFT